MASSTLSGDENELHTPQAGTGGTRLVRRACRRVHTHLDEPPLFGLADRFIARERPSRDDL